MRKSYAAQLAETERKVRVIYISSYIPRPCGIATFTKDLTTSINVLNPHCLAEIIAVDPPEISYRYPWEVKYRFSQENWNSYAAAADYINQSSVEAVCIEHEYGLYGGRRGRMIVDFAKLIQKPIVVSFHTVVPYDEEYDPTIIQELSKVSEAVVVMINHTAERLIHEYKVDPNKIVVIPHGVPDMPLLESPIGKGQLDLNHRTVLSTFGLINDNKGIEYVIEALPEIVAKIPNLVYLILGETHPVLKRRNGEKYRRKLQGLVRHLHLRDHVRFVNRYLALEELLRYLQATDLYITPYLYSQQISSGTLSYALGAGLPCISTPYIYANEVLDGNKGLLVPPRDSKAIAHAVVKLATNNNLRDKIKRTAYAFGRQMTWDNVALKHLDLFDTIVERADKEPNAKA